MDVSPVFVLSGASHGVPCVTEQRERNTEPVADNELQRSITFT
jgi:hypothetical protein